MVLNFQIEEVLDRLMKNEEAQKLSEQKKGELAKKFMLKWVDKKNHSGEERPKFVVPKVNDFGPSWRDGKAFLGVLHSIDPELVNHEQVKKSTNIENLNMAFDLAEEHFAIPRFLDAVDIDVDKPDEKSIMMYVAEMIKVAETRTEQSTATVTPEMHRFDNLMLWTSGAEQALKKKHKLRKYTPHDYRDYVDFCSVLGEKKSILDEISKSIDPEQVTMLKATFEQLEKSNTKWRDGLDRGLPKKYAKVTDVLTKVEKERGRRFRKSGLFNTFNSSS